MAQSQVVGRRDAPDLIPVKGGWLARTSRKSDLHVAVVADTKDAAIKKLDAEVAAWRRLREDRANA